MHLTRAKVRRSGPAGLQSLSGEPTLWEAGALLMQTGDPCARQDITAAAQMRRKNLEVIPKCEEAPVQAKGPAQCDRPISQANCRTGKIQSVSIFPMGRLAYVGLPHPGWNATHHLKCRTSNRNCQRRIEMTPAPHP
ncbi:DUF6118 family protein [Sphingobium sp.]|uniref:DUF6118 family protein n=1 Tax=Sphingobium sp. TaxID=1912891 RepID=UPI0039B91F61